MYFICSVVDKIGYEENCPQRVGVISGQDVYEAAHLEQAGYLELGTPEF